MDNLAPLLRAFYTGALSSEERSSIHARLLQSLRDPACISAGADYITQLTTKPDLQPDPFVLHYALHSLEVCARTSFASTPRETRSRLLQLLLDFLVSAHARSTSHAPNIASIPSHALNKAAVAAVQLGLREWVNDSTHAFPRVILALIDQNGHTAESLPRILAGIGLVTGLVDAAVDGTRKDLPSADRAILLRQLKNIADGIVAALEIGMRISGPHFPRSVAVSAVRAVGSLVRVEPSCAAESVAVLKRCVQGRSDLIGAEILGVLAEIYGEAKVKMPADWQSTIAHASGLLEAVAMGEAGLGDDEDVCLYRVRLIGYGEAVARRIIALGERVDALQRLFNGLMGISLRWAEDYPDQFVAALDAWLSILECLEDAEVESNELLVRVYGAVSDLCVKRSMHFSNGKVLGLLDEPDENQQGWSKRNGRHDSWRIQTIFRWDEDAPVMAEVASDPVTMSSVLFASSDQTGDVDTVDQGDSLSACSRATYVRKCVETMVACASMNSETVGVGVSEFVRNILQMKAQHFSQAKEVMKTDVEDLCTASLIAYCIVPLLPPNSSHLQQLFQVMPELMKSAVERREAKLAALLLRTAASLAKILANASPEFVQRVGSSLVPFGRKVLSSADCPEPVTVAAVLLLLSLDRFGRKVLFQREPPIEASMIVDTSHYAVAAIGIACMTRWALVPERDPKTSLPIKWTAEEWEMRKSGFQQLCAGVFIGLHKAVMGLGTTTDVNNWDIMLAVARGAGLLKTMVLSLQSIHGKSTDAFWTGVGSRTTQECMQALIGLRTHVSNAHSGMDADSRRVCCGVMGCIVGALESTLRVCARQVSAEAPDLAGKTIETVLEFAASQSSVRLTYAALRLIREQLANGSGLSPGPSIQLAAQTLDRGVEQDVCVAAVNVLVEALKQHWRDFWPGDVVSLQVNGSSSPASVTADASTQGLYMGAMHGLLKGLKSPDLATCRAALLGLQSLDAARRLYSRRAAFRENGAGDAVLTECLRIMGAGGEARRESLADEAVEVVWGIAKVDVGEFYSRTLPGAIKELGGISEEQGRALVDIFASVKERPGFVRKAASFANDFVYLRSLNNGPIL